MSICARCEHWTLKTCADKAAQGRGHCVGFLAAAMDFVPWDDPKCGLYRKARQIEPREKWIAARIEAAESNAKVPPA